MLRIAMPNYSAADVYESCTRGVSDSDRRGRFDASESGIERADKLFRNAGGAGTFRDLMQGDFALSDASAEDMKWLYERRLVGARAAGGIYDVIFDSSPYGLCPLCGRGDVSTLDHYLPKATYPALAVNPVNLIPACADCNKRKSSLVEDTLHPYFDDVQNEQWLRAEIIEGAAPVAQYFVDAPSRWPDKFVRRVTCHFKMFNLWERYSIWAAREISGLRIRLDGLPEEDKASEARTYLTRETIRWRADCLNSWQSALYAALAESDWYCCGGFKF
jgi:hypothetical protein